MRIIIFSRKITFIVVAFGASLIGCAQEKNNYPKGLSVDSGIEKKCKRSKELNSFKTTWRINDKESKGNMFFGSGNLPLMSFIITNKKDTSLNFIGMIVPYGFQINLKDNNCIIEAVVSSRNEKFFKSNLEDKEWSYGAGAKAKTYTLVMNKTSNFKVGEKIYGYIKFSSNYLYHKTNDKEAAEKWDFDYEGLFEVDTKMMLH
jgi:hypothetical protein